MISQTALARHQKMAQDIDKRIRNEFAGKFPGIEPIEIHCMWPVACSYTILTESRQFNGWITPAGHIKKDTLTEEI